MAARKRFEVMLEKDEKSTVTSIIIPLDVHKEFGTRARVPVRGTINGFPFRSSIFPMAGGRHYMVVNKPTREGAKVKGGDIIKVVMERDEEAREITPPEDLARAMKGNKAARAAWDKLSHTNRKEYAYAVESAKKPETRARRIEKVMAELSAPSAGGKAKA
ncbi:MAG TPA: YdeI/OmpD-associated family protein [Blastocatellia bacterium]|nr:YdeI/OmpD-associated family protein [Blastocatellia bacterium]